MWGFASDFESVPLSTCHSNSLSSTTVTGSSAVVVNGPYPSLADTISRQRSENKKTVALSGPILVRQRRCNERKIFAHLFAIAFLLRFVELCILHSDLLLPSRYEFSG
jgi:hypothetical protein